MECRALSFRQLPHQPRLFLDFFDSFPRVSKFYDHPPTFESVKAAASALDYPPERRAEVAAILRGQNARFGAGDATRDNLDRFAKGAVAVVSGQQVALFSGPSYAIYKAISAIHIAQQLTDSGIDAVPVFWMATEDHDLDEVRYSTWFNAGKLKHFELPGNGDAGLPVGQIALGPAVRAMVDEAASILSAPGGELLAATLRESYGPQETYGSAFGKLFSRVFAEQGLILLDPLDPRLHRTGIDLLRRAVEQRDDITKSLLARDEELQRAGYDAQVKVTARSTLLFHMGGAQSGVKRQPITANGAKFVCGEVVWTKDELLSAIQSAPEDFSANALFRPVLQDYLLPTVTLIAGPAEIAYFAQAEVVYKKLLGRMTVVLPRAAFTLLDAKGEKLLEKYGLTPEDVWRGPQELRAKMDGSSVPKSLAKNFDKLARDTERKLAQLKTQVEHLDSTLGGAVETTREKIVFQLDKLKRKAGEAYALKTGLLDAHQEFLESLLYPHKAEQSRELCFLPFLAHWGPAGIKELLRAAACESSGHKILRIP